MSQIVKYRCGVIIDPQLCKKCGTCYKVCPADIFAYDDNTRNLTVLYPDECMYCGACILDCPVEGAITLDIPMASL